MFKHPSSALLFIYFAFVGTSSADFPLIRDSQPARVWVDTSAPSGVRTVAGWFADDLERVSGARPEVVDAKPAAGATVLVGVLGSGGELDELVATGAVDVSAVEGRIESSVTVVAKDNEQLLVIAGSDKRGAIYGMLDLSRRMGVSPWYWWADSPVTKRTDFALPPEAIVRGEPKVRYRGIFLNDEEPALGGWAREKFGKCNSEFYSHVYELILRNRGNFLWPAMWGRSLFDDDPKSQGLADELGVVLSTTHHEPLQRAHAEWSRYGKGPWDYDRNAEVLREFWREGIRRMGDKESVVTLGMRGDGDMPMTDDANIELLQRIVRDQRKIIAEELGADPADQPQVWALYKEVQEYYDRGMRAPEDVTFLMCDDNWGNVRRLPHPDEARQPGGYGMYYHFDYVGGPRSYMWLNTNSLPRVWEQMRLCWDHGVDKIWVVNVGDLKPMEEPIDFFLTMAYDPDQFPVDSSGEAIDDWRRRWAAEQFGSEHAEKTADLLKRYAKLAARSTPELLTASTYSLENYNEWGRVLEEWQTLAADAEAVEDQLPEITQSAYYQLVLHPVLAMANLHEMYHAVAMNNSSAASGDPAANAYADKAEACFARDSELTQRYHSLEGGKWNHMMSQTHIGYTSWNNPRRQVMPAVKRVEGDGSPASQRPLVTADREIPAGATGFIEFDKYISMEATSNSSAVAADGVEWVKLGDHGRTGSAMATAPFAAPSTPAGQGPCLEYPLWLTSEGPVEVDLYLSPSQDIYGGDDHGIRFAVSIDDGAPTVIDMHADRSTNEHNSYMWGQRVGSAIHIATTPKLEAGPGAHTLRFWRIDTGAVLQKIVVKTGDVAPSYLGPPESPRAP